MSFFFRCQSGRLNRNSRGMSLIEVLVAVALMSILTLGMMSLMTAQQRQVRVLKQKQESIDLKNMMLLYLGRTDVCNFNMSSATSPGAIDLSKATQATPSSAVYSLPKLYAGNSSSSAVLAQPNSSLPGGVSGLEVESIQLRGLYPTGNPLEALGVLVVNFKDKSTELPMTPVMMPQRVVGTGSISSFTLSGCSGVSGPRNAIHYMYDERGITSNRKAPGNPPLSIVSYTIILANTGPLMINGNMNYNHRGTQNAEVHAVILVDGDQVAENRAGLTNEYGSNIPLVGKTKDLDPGPHTVEIALSEYTSPGNQLDAVKAAATIFAPNELSP